MLPSLIPMTFENVFSSFPGQVPLANHNRHSLPFHP